MLGNAIERPFDRDRMSMVPRHSATSAAHLALFQLQALPPEEAVLGTAVLLKVLAERCRVTVAECESMAKRVLDAPEEGDRPTDNALQVLRDFAGSRLMGQTVTLG